MHIIRTRDTCRYPAPRKDRRSAVGFDTSPTGKPESVEVQRWVMLIAHRIQKAEIPEGFERIQTTVTAIRAATIFLGHGGQHGFAGTSRRLPIAWNEMHDPALRNEFPNSENSQ